MQIVTAEEMYAIDRYTINTIGISEESLMENAGQAVAKELLTCISPSNRIAILVGTGNNGGDGIVIARILKNLQYEVDLWVIPPLTKVTGAAKKHLEIYQHCGFHFFEYPTNVATFFHQLEKYDTIIDALLGIGMKGELRSPYKEIIEALNSIQAKVYAIDIPSGVQANGGEVSTAVQATWTYTIQCPKIGAYTFPSRNFYGDQIIVDIGIPSIAIEKNAETRCLWQQQNFQDTIKIRPLDSHKGDFGKGLMIGGSRQLTGAVMMAAKAAIRCGAGLMTAAIPDEIFSIVASQLPESMYLPCPSMDGHFAGEIDVSNMEINAIAVGPGLGRSVEAGLTVEHVLKQEVPVVLDADALYHISKKKDLLTTRKNPTILTPHAGEMARLLNCSVQKIEQNRFEIAQQYARKYRVYLVLKGPFTIVTTPEGTQYVNTTGNPALAKGGSGDVLTGMVLAFIMSQQNIQTAINNAVFLHGAVADYLIHQRHSVYDVMATDIIDAIPQVLHSLSVGSNDR